MTKEIWTNDILTNDKQSTVTSLFSSLIEWMEDNNAYESTIIKTCLLFVQALDQWEYLYTYKNTYLAKIGLSPPFNNPNLQEFL